MPTHLARLPYDQLISPTRRRSIQFRAPASMCDRLHLQALDVATCMTTSARTVRAQVPP